MPANLILASSGAIFTSLTLFHFDSSFRICPPFDLLSGAGNFFLWHALSPRSSVTASLSALAGKPGLPPPLRGIDPGILGLRQNFKRVFRAFWRDPVPQFI